MHSPKPDLQTMRRVEELLREQLLDMGIDISTLPPHEISAKMHCAVYPNGALSYSWEYTPILDVSPEKQDDGTVTWRFFTRDEPVQ